MNQKAKNRFIKKILSVGVPILLLFVIWGIAIGSPESRLLQEIVGADQSLKRFDGMPVIVSQKGYGVSISPENIITDINAPIIFIMAIKNPFKEPFQFSIKNVKVYTEKKDLGILDSEELLTEARKGFSKKNYDLNKEQEKEMAFYIEEQLRMLKDKLLTTQAIAPESTIMGRIYVRAPAGTEELTVEVTFSNEKHRFNFHVIES